jgi:uncharacterized membrane protein YqjE
MGATATSPLDAFRVLRSARGALIDQLALHGQLARIEWTQEKRRLLKMLALMLAGFACLLCILLSAGVLVMALCWDTPARLPAIGMLVAAYGCGLIIAWRRMQVIADAGDQSFAATRAELGRDLELLREHL